MERPLTAKLNERFGGSPLSPAQEAELIARSFGAAFPVAEPLPESEREIRHVEADIESALIIDGIKTPQEKPRPQSLLTIVTSRLQSIKPRTQVRADEVRETLAALQEPLAAADELVTVLQMEHFEALEERMQRLQERGRAVRDRLEDELRNAVNKAMMAKNESETAKVRCKARLESHQDERRAIRRDRFATAEQRDDADRNVENGARALMAAKEMDLRREQELAAAQNAVRLAQSELRGCEIGLDQCQAEIQGTQYHDPETGLSVQPQESW